MVDDNVPLRHQLYGLAMTLLCEWREAKLNLIYATEKGGGNRTHALDQLERERLSRYDAIQRCYIP